MGKKSDKGKHIGRAGEMEQRKDQQLQMRNRVNKRAEPRNARTKPPIGKK